MRLLEDERKFFYSDAQLLNGNGAEIKEEILNMLCFEQLDIKVCYEQQME